MVSDRAVSEHLVHLCPYLFQQIKNKNMCILIKLELLVYPYIIQQTQDFHHQGFQGQLLGPVLSNLLAVDLF